MSQPIQNYWTLGRGEINFFGSSVRFGKLREPKYLDSGLDAQFDLWTVPHFCHPWDKSRNPSKIYLSSPHSAGRLSTHSRQFFFEGSMRVSVLNDALKSMYNAEKRGKRQVMIRPSSKVIIKFLLVMQKHGYIGEFEYVDDHRSGKIVVELNGRLNKCGVISPRFDVGVKEIEPWTARLLPSRQFGYIVLTTSAGIMDHEEARRKNVGGKVLGFFY
ncbi:small ribosomal subunit protein uS8-like [Cornus florida]|uniref:small ribosomal subunit protein uS8-like n=2 Tax=Cornus florida TaxID=4283 RepID=UPI00289A274E|nr:small ribosomal subunit protein uS8-like [Cornus florida]